MASPVPGGTCSSPTAAASESGGSGQCGQSWGIPQSADPAHPSRGSSPALPRLRPSPPGAPPPLPQSAASLGLCLRWSPENPLRLRPQGCFSSTPPGPHQERVTRREPMVCCFVQATHVCRCQALGSTRGITPAYKFVSLSPADLICKMGIITLSVLDIKVVVTPALGSPIPTWRVEPSLR